MLTVKKAETKSELEDVRALMRSFVEWHYDRHAEYHALIDKYFDTGEFETELAELPGAFAPPGGRLLIAVEDGKTAGCVALKDIGGGACEMKRMFVSTAFHGRGVGHLLGAAIVSEARDMGYEVMRLDTGPKQVEAQGLYRRLGFRRTEPYYDLDPEMQAWLIFMELDLAVARD